MGNGCYYKYMETILDSDTFQQLFGDDPSQERVGDMLEALLGMFEMAALFFGRSGATCCC